MRIGRGLETNKGLWSKEEDEKLVAYIKRYRIWNWTHMPKAAGLARSGKSCRHRWMNYLRPNLRRDIFTPQEEEEIVRLQRLLGNRWSAIAAKLPGRTDNDIKNYWNARLRTRVHAIDGDRKGQTKIWNSGNNTASKSEIQDCRHDRTVILDSYDVSHYNFPGARSEQEIDSLWSELSPLENQVTLPGHQFPESPNWYQYLDEDAFSILGHQHIDDHDNASSSSCYYVDKLWIDI